MLIASQDGKPLFCDTIEIKLKNLQPRLHCFLTQFVEAAPSHIHRSVLKFVSLAISC